MSEERRGTLLAVAAYLMWGLFPLYWPLLEPAGAIEILAHRVVWSLVVVAIGYVASRRPWRRLPHDRRRLSLLAVAAVVIAVNWGVYIWGVNHDHVVDTSLGYFVNPLVTVALGVVILGERLRRSQWFAIAIAAAGVVVLAVQAGRPPWIALTLSVSFGTYGLVKKVVGVPPVDGLVVETAILSPVALGYLIALGVTGNGTFTSHGAGHASLLAGAGIVTAVPLLAFAGAAPRVPLSHLGLLQYLTPTMQFLLGVFLRHEPLPALRLLGFVVVWLALVLLSVDGVRHRSSRTVGVSEPAIAAAEVEQRVVA